MYNCARLHTLFDSYERGVENGEIGAVPQNPKWTCSDENGIRIPGYWNSVKIVCL